MTASKVGEEEDHLHYHGVDKAEQHLSVNEALEIFLREITPTGIETLGTKSSNNRVLASDVVSPTDLPTHGRSTRDGYAVKLSKDSEADLTEASFSVIGEVRIGTFSDLVIRDGEAAKIATGAYVPRGANAVVMREYAQVDDSRLRVTRPVKIRENILSPGEDLAKGQILLRSGTRIRPHHIALLSLVGVQRAKVHRKPKVAIFSTGDELKDSFQKKKGSKSGAATFDANRPFVRSMIEELGGIPIDLGIARDNFNEIKSKIATGLRRGDALVLSAGSSVGERDYVSSAAESITGLKMLTHGVAMRPSSPTGLAIYRGKPVVFLPGFPTSAIVSFLVFGRPAILKLSGSSSTEIPTVRASIDENFEGKPGITHFLRVAVRRDAQKYRATIVRPTEAQYSSWLSEANGIAVIGAGDTAKVSKDEEVPVWLIGDLN